MDNNKDPKSQHSKLGSFSIETGVETLTRTLPGDKTNITESKGTEQAGVVTLKVFGTIDLLTSSEFQKHAMDFISKGYKYIFLDFTKLDFIDSMGLSTVLMIYQKIFEAGGSLSIINPKPSIMVVLKITKVNQKILVFNTIDEAKAFITHGENK
ncbi:MAG: putative anti-sigma factor antagonist [Spirochaetes bacterium ADurb.BinA120]|nr:MAG: putative anti-sigma factor antagonist [Spirochaetes bacterium ADurb.BinA120]